MSIRVHDGRAKNATVFVTTDDETWADIVGGRITESSAVASGALALTGDRRATIRLGKIFSRHRLLANGGADNQSRVWIGNLRMLIALETIGYAWQKLD